MKTLEEIKREYARERGFMGLLQMEDYGMIGVRDVDEISKRYAKEVAREAYIVKYETGYWNNSSFNTVFVTFDKETAEGYVKKFNEVLGRLKSNHLGVNKPPNFRHWSRLNETYEAFIEEIEIR